MSRDLKKTILLVENERVGASAEAHAIQRFGYTVLAADSGEEAVRMALSDESISLILMNVDVDGEPGGTEAARQLLERRNLPIIFLIPESERGAAERIRGIPRYGCVTKNSGEVILQSSIEMAFELFEAHQKFLSEVVSLRETEEKYRRIVETAIEGILSLDSDTRVTFVNRQLSSMLGYAPEEMIGQKFEAFLAEDQLNDHHVQMALRSRGQDAVYERRIRKKDGGLLWATVSAKVITDAEGKHAGSFAMLTDITARKKTEEALKESEDRYRSLYDKAPVMLHSIDIRGNLVSVSDFWLSTLGYTREEVLGRKSSEFLSEASRKYANDTVLPEFRRTGYCYNIEYQFVKKNGEVIDALLSAISERDESGTILRSFAVVTDITERKRAEEALRESEENFKAIANYAASWEAWFSPEGKLLWMNPYSVNLTGYTPEECIAAEDYLSLVIAEEDRASVQEQFRGAMRGSSAENVEMRSLRKDGSKIWLSVSWQPILDSNERLLGFRTSSRDISQRKQMEEQLRRSLEEKEVLLREVHHRVKNNLNVISSLLSLQSSAIQTPEQAIAAFRNSRDRIMAMALVHKELYESRNYARVDMNEYLSTLTRHMLQAYGSGGQIRLSAQAEGIVLSVNTSIPCGLILNELITNAFKHAFPHGGTGEIRIVLGTTDDGLLELSVSDNGIGLPAGSDAGQTLGFRLVRLLTEQLQGTISISNENGTRCVIRFPIAPN